MHINSRFSLSSKEDIYDFLHKLDLVYEEKDNNEDVLYFYVDFSNLLKKVPDNKYIMKFHDVQTGVDPIKMEESNKNTEEICAKRLGMEVSKYREKLEENVEELYKLNRLKWENYINKKYKNTIITVKPKTKNENMDFCKSDTPQSKTIKQPTKKELEQKERDLNGLYEYLDKIEDSLDELKKKGKENTSEHSKLITTKIEVQKDINIIRRSYGEVLGNQNSMGRRSFVSYNSDEPNYQYIVSHHEEQLNSVAEGQFSKNAKEEMLKDIKNIAKNILTNRQYIIFKFYYFNGLTQQEIADLMGLKQPTINEHISNIIEKIRENL